MKKAILVLLFTVLAIFLTAIILNPALEFLLKKQLSVIFKGSEVSIGSCRLNPARQLSIFDLRIKNKKVYAFLVKEIKAEYSIFSIFKGEIRKLTLKDAQIYVNLPQNNISVVPQFLNLGSRGAFLVKSLELFDLNLDLKAQDLLLSGILSARADLAGKKFDYLDIGIDSLGINGFNLSNIKIKAAQGSPEGSLAISRIKYNKLNILDTKCRVMLSGKELLLENIDAGAFNGNIGGNLNFNIDDDLSYAAVLRITNLDIAKFIDDFELNEKLSMSGKLSGDLSIKGEGPEIRILNGRLSSFEPGGTLIIKDAKFLENMARSTGQSLDFLLESFKDYRYNVGVMKLFLDKGNLILDAALEGEAGKRNISIVLHEF